MREEVVVEIPDVGQCLAAGTPILILPPTKPYSFEYPFELKWRKSLDDNRTLTYEVF